METVSNASNLHVYFQWLSFCLVGEVIGFSRDTLHQLNSKNSLRLIKKSNMFKASLKGVVSHRCSRPLSDMLCFCS